MRLFELTNELTCRLPPRWQTHLRYALHLSGRELTLPPGTWLLELEARDDNALYRLANGSVLALPQPLSTNEARPVDYPEAVRAMAAYRSPEEAVLDDWGLQVEHIDSSAPFRLIKCPLCWGTEFVSVDFAQVWCNTCSANFIVRHTAGDPGFVVDCTWEHYSGRQAHYLLPRTADLCLTLVLKDSGDPLDFTHGDACWRDDCTPEQLSLTGPDSALRPGLHACHVGTLYGWSLSGRVPAHYDYNWHGSATLLWPDEREEAWPETAFVRTSHLTHDERRDLEQGVWELEKQIGDDSVGYRQGLLGTVKALLARPVAAPRVAYRVPFPDAGLLGEGEKYLLHHWLLKRDERLVSCTRIRSGWWSRRGTVPQAAGASCGITCVLGVDMRQTGHIWRATESTDCTICVASCGRKRAGTWTWQHVGNHSLDFGSRIDRWCKNGKVPIDGTKRKAPTRASASARRQ